MDTILYVLNIPYFVSSLGTVTMIGIFIGSLLWNGDMKLATKCILSVFVYALFVMLMATSKNILLEHDPQQLWLQPILITSFIAIAYFIGILLGVGIHCFVNRNHKMR